MKKTGVSSVILTQFAGADNLKENKMAKIFISDLNVNDKVDSLFLLSKKNLKLTKQDKPYLEIALADKTGKIEARLWDNAEEFNKLADTGDVVHIKGLVDKFREEKQVKIDTLEKASEEDFDYSDMVRVVEGRDEIQKGVLDYLKDIKNPWIAKLASEFTEDTDLMVMLVNGIGAKSWHNAYIGGLIEHTYEVMCVVDKVCDFYPQADRDMAIFGAFLHDIGKVYELDVKKMEYTVEGGLIGHIGIGHKMLVEKISNISDFPDEAAMKLEHIVLSHHGEYEQQSPVLPKTLEATIIYQTDELVSQANAVKEIMISQGEEGKEWSNYVSIKNRKYYIKKEEEEEKEPPKKGKKKKKEEELF